MINAYIRVVSALSRLGGGLAVLLLAAAVLAVCHMVFVRYILNGSTIWQTEFAIYSLVAATFIGSGHVLMRKGHVGVDLLPIALGGRRRIALELASGILSIVFLALLAWSGWTFFQEAWENDWRTMTVWGPPLWILLAPLPLGIGLLILQYVAELVKIARGEHLDNVPGPVSDRGSEQ